MCWLTGRPIVLRSAELLPLTGVTLVLNPLGAFFVLLVVMVAVPATLYGIGYADHGLGHPHGGLCVPALHHHAAPRAHGRKRGHLHGAVGAHGR